MTRGWLATPWNHEAELYTAPGRLTVKLRLGEAPDEIATMSDVRRGVARPQERTGVGAVDRVLAHFSDAVRITRVHAAAASLGRLAGTGHRHFDDVEHAIGLSRTFDVRIDRQCRIDSVVDALRRLNEVEWVTPQYLVTTSSTGAALLAVADAAPVMPIDDLHAWSSRHQVGALEAAAYEPGDPAVTVGLADTGVTPGHPELAGRLRSGVDTVRLTSADLAAGMQLVGDTTGVDTDPVDEVGHGTGCAGIIFAAGHAMPPGLAAGCSLLPARVLGSAGLGVTGPRFGVGTSPDIDEGLKWGVDLGAQVFNLSFGTPEQMLGPHDPMPHADVVAYAAARGCVLVAASGNSGKEERYTPACLPEVIAVGSVDASDSPSAFSTRGDHVALCAPGEHVASAGIEGYAVISGTSFAAPFVTAAAALLVSRARRRSYPIQVDEVRELLVSSARPFPDSSTRGCGSGVLDAYGALQALDAQIDRGPPEGRDMTP